MPPAFVFRIDLSEKFAKARIGTWSWDWGTGIEVSVSGTRTYGFALELCWRRRLRRQLLGRRTPVPSVGTDGDCRRGSVPGLGGLGGGLVCGGLCVAVLCLGRDVAAVVRGESAVGTGRRVAGQLDGDTSRNK